MPDSDTRLGRVLVTGGASGLGAAVVAAVAARDGQPVVLDRQAPPGIHPYVLVDLADTAQTERVVRVNLLGTAAVVRAALPALTQGRGRVVTVASTLGLRALPEATAYCASKFAVVGLSRALGAELAGQVEVTCLIPGGMSTPFFDGRPEQYRPGPDAPLMDPRAVAETVVDVLARPPGATIRELVVTAEGEPSWP